jgi:hypothetical protein
MLLGAKRFFCFGLSILHRLNAPLIGTFGPACFLRLVKICVRCPYFFDRNTAASPPDSRCQAATAPHCHFSKRVNMELSNPLLDPKSVEGLEYAVV